MKRKGDKSSEQGRGKEINRWKLRVVAREREKGIHREREMERISESERERSERTQRVMAPKGALC